MGSMPPIFISSSDEEDHVTVTSATRRSQQELRDDRAKSRRVPQQSLRPINIATDRQVAAANAEGSRRKSADASTSLEDRSGNSNRSVLMQELTIDAVGHASINWRQPQLDQPVQPPTLKSRPLSRKCAIDMEAVASSTDSGSDPSHYPPPKATPTSVPAAPVSKPRNKPLTGYLLIDLANELHLQFDIAGFAEKHDTTVEEILDIFSALVSMPIVEFAARGHDRIKEARAKVKEHKAAIDAAFYPSKLPQKKRKGPLGTAVRDVENLGVHDDGPTRWE